jgi:hypothetical protein
MSYFIVHTSEDGDVSLEVVTKAEILKRLTPDKDGYVEYRAEEIHDKLPESYADLCAQGGMYIIKGELVIPQPKKVVTTFEIE